MTAVIGASPPGDYRRGMTARDDVRRLAAVLRRPGTSDVASLRNAQQAMTKASGEAARQLGVFVERVADLTADELRELHDETFATGRLAGVLPVVERLIRGSGSSAERDAGLDALAPALECLEADRNPYAYVVRALCCALLARASGAGEDGAPRCDLR